jgi:hypothetical protein
MTGHAASAGLGLYPCVTRTAIWEEGLNDSRKALFHEVPRGTLNRALQWPS